MRERLIGRVVLLVALAVFTVDLQAQTRPVVVAILPFEDLGSYGQDKEILRALEVGIPATIASELALHSELRLADPGRVARALQRQNAGGRLDAATAARIGKDAGASYAVTGNFADFYGKIRLDARIIDTESGQIVKVVSNAGTQLEEREELYRIIQTVGHRVLAAGTDGRAPGLEPQTIPTEALIQFSLGLLHEQRGNASRAGEHFRRALSAFPGYREAQDGLRRVGTP